MQSTADMEQEAELEVSITFDELQCFDSEDISTCVSVQSALKICQKSVANLSAKTVEVLSLWLRKLLKGYINETECCIEVFKCLYEWLLRMKADVTPENKTACTDFIMLLADAADFAEWAKAKLLAAGERLVHTTAFFLLAIVFSCLQMSNENQVEELKEHESKAIELHLSVLHILQEITNASTRAHARITPILRQLVEIADFLSLKLTHINAFVKTSKTMTSICTHYKSLEPSQNEGNGMPDWMQETLLHLCDTVLNKLELVYEQSSTSPDQHMKIIQVYLIMLHKLLNTGVRHMDKTVLEAIFLLLNGRENKPTSDIIPEIPLLMNKYMQPYIMQIYELLYQLEDFQKHLMTCLNEAAQNNEDYDELCLDYVNVCIIDDAELNQLTYQILQNIFEYLCRDAGNFCNATRYKRILEVFGSLLHVCCSEELFNYFYAGLFEDDVIKSQICADVLMLSYRLEEKQSGWSKNALEKLTKYWLKCNNSYAMFSQNPSQWHVQRMLKYFHNLNRNRDPPVFNLHNYRYVSCVSAKTEQEQHLWLLQLQRLLHNPLNDIEQYYEILALMELLSSASSDWLLSLPASINELLLKGTYQRLNNTYFKLALKANSATKLRILQTVMPSKSVATSCWHVQRFLHDCRNSGNAQLKSLAGQHAPATDLCSLLQTLQPTLPLPTASIDNPQINYAKLAYRSKQKHRCKQANLKRKRAECEPKNILEQLEQNTQQLSQCNSDLDAANLKQLSSIVKTLQNILVEQQIL